MADIKFYNIELRSFFLCRIIKFCGHDAHIQENHIAVLHSTSGCWELQSHWLSCIFTHWAVFWMFSSYAPTPIKAHVYSDLFLFLASHPIFFFRPWLQICSYDWLCSPVPGDHKWITNRAFIPKLYFISKYRITDLSKLSIIKLEGAGPGPPVCVWNIYLYYVKFEKVLYIYIDKHEYMILKVAKGICRSMPRNK